MQLQLARQPGVLAGPGARLALAPLDAALLAWLALEGPTPRNRLAELLWPEKANEAARNSLRQRLFQLRRQVGAELVAGGAVIALAAGIGHDLHEADSLLDGVALEIGGEFGQWLALQRSRRRARVRDALADLAGMAEAAGDWADALAHAGELLALEPLSEEAHRRLIRLHYLAGDRAAAMLAFDRCAQLLKDEVGTVPSEETLALLRTVSSAQPEPPLPARTAVPASVLRPPRLVGRTRELNSLGAAWQAGQVAALVGEAGLGKSRLLQEFAASRTQVLLVAGRPGDSGVPLATLARLLRGVLGESDRTAVAAVLPGPLRGEVARVLPELASDAAVRTGDGQRVQLLRAVHALITGCAPHATLVVDDLHFADAASLELLAGLIDGTDAAPGPSTLRWLLAWRPAEAGSPLQALHDQLVEQVRLVVLPLEPLDEPALAELVDSLGLPGVRGPALAPVLRQRTGGNPLFALETLKQAWIEGGPGALAGEPQLPRPLSVGRLIERRIAQLSPGALALARVASIAGVDFSIELAESVLQAGALQFADALNELSAAQVLRDTAFAHDLVHDAVRGSVPRAIAQLLHTRVAAWLEPRGGEPARIAQHWREAGRDVQALPWLAKAAEAATRALRPLEAVAFREAISCIEEARGDRAAAFVAQLDAVHSLVQSDNEAGAVSARLDRLDRLADGDTARAEALLARATALQMRGEVAQAVAPAEAALAIATAAADAALLARVRRLLGGCLGLVDRPADAARHLEAALVWIDEHAGDGERGEAHGDLAVIHDNLGRLEEGLVQHRLAQQLCLRAGRTADASVACGNLACNRIDAGDLAAADEALQRGQQLAAALDGAVSHHAHLQILRALVLAHLGRYGDALAQSELAVAHTERQQPGFVWRARMRQAQLWRHLGQWARLGRLLEGMPPDEELALALRVQRTQLRWHATAAVGSAASREAAERRLLAARDELEGAGRPDLALPLRLEAAGLLPPNEAWRELRAVRAEAQRLGHRGTVLAAHLSAARLLRETDPAAAADEARAALNLAAGGVASTALLPAERWLHAGLALRAAGDAQGDAVLREGAAWLQATASTEVPEAFRDSFLHRQPVHAALRDAGR
ncbi:MAG: AAA family ATPase [Piscinibacter sp.]|nr:AAA family ATPase [Piscinibacter sp.]